GGARQARAAPAPAAPRPDRGTEGAEGARGRCRRPPTAALRPGNPTVAAPRARAVRAGREGARAARARLRWREGPCAHPSRATQRLPSSERPMAHPPLRVEARPRARAASVRAEALHFLLRAAEEVEEAVEAGGAERGVGHLEEGGLGAEGDAERGAAEHLAVVRAVAHRHDLGR